MSSSAVEIHRTSPVVQLDTFYECPTKNVRVSDQMSNRKYKNINLVDEKSKTQVTIKDKNYVLCLLAVFIGTGST